MRFRPTLKVDRLEASFYREEISRAFSAGLSDERTGHPAAEIPVRMPENKTNKKQNLKKLKIGEKQKLRKLNMTQEKKKK